MSWLLVREKDSVTRLELCPMILFYNRPPETQIICSYQRELEALEETL